MIVKQITWNTVYFKSTIRLYIVRVMINQREKETTSKREEKRKEESLRHLYIKLLLTELLVFEIKTMLNLLLKQS